MSGGRRSMVGAIQMSSGADPQKNLRTVARLLEEAHAKGCVLAVLPENFAFVGKRDSDKLAVAEMPGAGPVQEFLARAAARHSMWIVAGSLPLRTPETKLCYGTCLVFDADGRELCSYRKIHLFDVDLPDSDESYRESASMDPGNAAVVVDTPAGRVGLSICYDLRFPELYRSLVGQGAEALAVPAAFTFATGTAHWHSLLRARAIENLAYVIAAAQHGTHPNGRRTFGHSLVADPWGRVLAEQGSGDGVVVAEIDQNLTHKLRSEFPVLKHRRL